MSHRVNVVLDNYAWEALQSVPKGERSQIINRLVIDWDMRQRRLQAAEEMDRLRESLEPLPGTTEEWIREERIAH